MLILISTNDGKRFFLPNDLQSLERIVTDFEDIQSLEYINPYKDIVAPDDVVENMVLESLSFGEALRAIRKGSKLTQMQLQNAIGVKQATLSRWEKGRILPLDWQMEAFIKHCGVSGIQEKRLLERWLSLRELL